MLMLKCKTCGEVFPGLYVPERSTDDFKSTSTNANPSHTCSRKHTNEYDTIDYMDWSWAQSEFYQSYTCNTSWYF